MSSQLIELSNALAQATDRAAATAVAVHAEARGSSSGVIWRAGIIVTSEHALRRDEEIHVTLADGRVVPAALVGRDPSTDLAVLKCAEATTPVNEFGDAAAIKPGSLTLVVGRTRASGPVAALGVVSLVAPERKTWTGTSLAPYIRLDVAIQPTAAGAAVVDASGRVFGIATPRFARFGAIAVPASTVNSVIDTLLQKGRIPRGYLGVGVQPVRLPDALRQSLHREAKTAAIVLEVEPESPAHKAGLVIGDIIVAIAGQPIARLEDIHARLQGAVIGKSLSLGFVRGGALQETTVVVSERLHGAE
ncbi:MAG: trypsin-like peptidase domain-containing protein [Candidatus Acidiferrum sp.]|jgi:S1-C subfamily serine protease